MNTSLNVTTKSKTVCTFYKIITNTKMKSLLVPTTQYAVFLSIIFVVVPHFCYGASLNQLDDISGLYNSTDKVKILTGQNFTKEILQRNHSTLVEFYNSYCGYCKRFAPSYKELAENLYSWREVLPIAAIDCANDNNNGICREYEVLGYPTLRYFGPNYNISPNNYGKNITSTNVTVITAWLAHFMAAEEKTINMPSWPDLQPLQPAAASHLFDGLDSLKKYVIMVYEPENSTIGIETILHFLRYPEISIKRITDIELAAKYQIDGSKYKIATVNRQGSIVPYEPVKNVSSPYKETIKSILASQQITEKPETILESTSVMHLQSAGEDKNNVNEIINVVKRNKHLVYQIDLEMAIKNILYNEIPKSSHIEGEKLLDLQRFLTVLQRYNPLGSSGQLLLSQLATFAHRHDKHLSGESFENELKKLEKEIGAISTSTHYVGCIGSQQGMRGYTCSLWQLFHFMSVQAANLNSSQDPTEVLQAMHGYIKYFFGCTDCSKHFQAMASRRNIMSTRSKDEAILWLWAAHNEVNARLSGDATEDPKFPKIQFPATDSCPQCYIELKNDFGENLEEKWNTSHVLQFLKNIYNPQYVSSYGLENDELLHSTLDKLKSQRVTSNVFSDIDMRMGILLYGFCIVMLVAAFKLFAFKGGYRRKRYSHDILAGTVVGKENFAIVPTVFVLFQSQRYYNSF